jgi:hypothetical protein
MGGRGVRGGKGAETVSWVLKTWRLRPFGPVNGMGRGILGRSVGEPWGLVKSSCGLGL